MTNLETMIYARSFVEKIIKGVNPTNDSIIPSNDVTRNPRLVKCFSYITDVLTRIIERPTVLDAMYQSHEWEITPSIIAKITLSSENVGISGIAKKINNALCSSRQFTAMPINRWLLENGYLMYNSDRSKGPKKIPTQKGIDAGFTLERKLHDNGQIRIRVRCNQSAQKLIIENLQDIVDFVSSSKTVPSAKKSNEAFEISRSELSNFEFSKTPLLISQIAHKINSLCIPARTRVLKATELTEWLQHIGVLKTYSINGQNFKLPSDLGIELGISVSHRTRDDADYSVALYNINAQHFIIDNLGAIARIV